MSLSIANRMRLLIAGCLLFLLAGCGGGAQQATPSVAPAEQQSGPRRLYYQAEVKGTYDLYRAALDGSDPEAVTNDAGDEIEPDVSPDGQRLVYSLGKAENTQMLQLHILDLSSGESTPLFEDETGGSDFGADWSPDGEQIVFQRYGQDGSSRIYVVNSNGENARMLTQTEGRDARPAWMPDGETILFTSTAANGKFGIYSVKVDGSDLKEVLRIEDSDLDRVVVSPDGSKIAFTKIDAARTYIYVANSDGSEPHAVLDPDNSPTYTKMPCWLDNDTLVFTGSTEFAAALYRVNIDGSEFEKIVDMEGRPVNYPVVQ